MRPRILLRTHYQVDEPRLIIAVVTKCSSPTDTRHEEAVAAALVKWAREIHEESLKISLPGAIYAVGNARSLGFLTPSNRWSAAGLALSYIEQTLRTEESASSILELSPAEQRLYLTYYVSAAGALLLKFGSWLMSRGGATDDELRQESIIENLIVGALDDYLRIATDIRDRTAIRRERDRMARSEYAASTKRHKRYPLLKTMERLELLRVERSAPAGERFYPDSEGRLKRLCTALVDIPTLERLAHTETFHTALDTVFYPGPPRVLTTLPRQEQLTKAYRYALACGLQACPLQYLDDILTALYPSFGAEHRSTAETLLEPLHRQFPSEVRFHVDRRGRRAFVLLSSASLENLPRLLPANSPPVTD